MKENTSKRKVSDGIEDFKLSNVRNYKSKTYNIRIGIYENKRIIIRYIKNNISYRLNISLDNLKSISYIIFNSCDTIYKAYKQIIYLLNKNSYEVENKNNKIYIILKQMILGEEVKCRLTFIKNNTDKTDEKIFELQEKNRELKNAIKIALLSIFLLFITYLSIVYKIYDNNRIQDGLINSKIINFYEQYNFIINNVIKKKVRLNLLLRASNIPEKEFAKNVNEIFKDYELELIKTKDGFIFGSYYSKYYFEFFPFSVDLRKVYTKKYKDNELRFFPKAENYSHFIDNCYLIYKKPFTEGGICSGKFPRYYKNAYIEYEINKGKKNFKIKEIEFFSLEFE